MKTIKTGVDWMDDLIPEGFPIKTTTIITGPGGSGKPLIGDTIAASWLKNGGSVIFISLQYPDQTFIAEGIKNISGIDIEDYREKTIFVQLDVEIPGYETVSKNLIKANMVKPEIWESVLQLAIKSLPQEDPGILIYASALNLLLFSPTYGEDILDKIKNTLASDHDQTYLFTVSTTAKEKEIAQLEKLADNIIMSRNEKNPFRLFMKILRMKDVSFLAEEVHVPIPHEVLAHMKEVAEHSRHRVIPAISKI